MTEYSGLPVRTIPVTETVAPAAQASVNAYADVVGSVMDALQFRHVSFTIICSGDHTITYKVEASNDAAFAVSVNVQAAADLVVGAAGSYSSTTAAWRYYKVMIVSKVAGDHGIATVVGVMK
jgi:hypothetical protein